MSRGRGGDAYNLAFFPLPQHVKGVRLGVSDEVC